MRLVDRKKGLGFLAMIVSGAMAGMVLNLALGSFAGNPEGILGGVSSALLIYGVS